MAKIKLKTNFSIRSRFSWRWAPPRMLRPDHSSRGRGRSHGHGMAMAMAKPWPWPWTWPYFSPPHTAGANIYMGPRQVDFRGGRPLTACSRLLPGPARQSQALQGIAWRARPGQADQFSMKNIENISLPFRSLD